MFSSGFQSQKGAVFNSTVIQPQQVLVPIPQPQQPQVQESKALNMGKPVGSATANKKEKKSTAPSELPITYSDYIKLKQSKKNAMPTQESGCYDSEQFRSIAGTATPVAPHVNPMASSIVISSHKPSLCAGKLSIHQQQNSNSSFAELIATDRGSSICHQSMIAGCTTQNPMAQSQFEPDKKQSLSHNEELYEMLLENKKLEQKMKEIEVKLIETEMKNSALAKEREKIQNAFDYVLTECKTVGSTAQLRLSGIIDQAKGICPLLSFMLMPH
jgi:hypothetical protein